MNAKKVLTIVILSELLLSLIPIFATSQANATSISDYDLLIIAPDEFIDELKPLKRFKDASARPTILISLNFVYQNFNGADTPEQIKKCIAYYESLYNVNSVMLVGDCDKFPVRYCKIYDPIHWGHGFCPSDLYYADLYKSNGSFDDWDGGNPPYGGNGSYGEMNEIPWQPGISTLDDINLDCVDLYPDIAVARVPASNETEVTTYVNKVINYEIKAPDNWFKRSLFVATTDWVQDFCKTKQKIANEYLTDFDIIRLYFPGNPCVSTANPSSININNALNQGVGFANYMGHGSRTGWVIPGDPYTTDDMVGLTNNDKLPVAFAVACNSANFHYGTTYLDKQGNEFNIPVECPNKCWPVDPNAPEAPEPAAIQCNDTESWDVDSMAEHFLVRRETGAIGYIGCYTGSQPNGRILDEYFFEGYDVSYKPAMLGALWNYAVNKYIDNDFHFDPNTPIDWWPQAAYHHIQKYLLFGDPSLRVGGAFTNTKSGLVWDWFGGPWFSYHRYRIARDVTVPDGMTLTVFPYASIFFEDGKKITAMGTSSKEGFIVGGTSDYPIWFMSLAPDPQSEHVVHGMKVAGQLRMRNGGEIKLY